MLHYHEGVVGEAPRGQLDDSGQICCQTKNQTQHANSLFVRNDIHTILNYKMKNACMKTTKALEDFWSSQIQPDPAHLQRKP